jgi:hypothetical protein
MLELRVWNLTSGNPLPRSPRLVLQARLEQYIYIYIYIYIYTDFVKHVTQKNTALCGCGTWSVIVRQEYRLRISDTILLKLRNVF